MIEKIEGAAILFVTFNVFLFVWTRYLFGMYEYESLLKSIVNTLVVSVSCFAVAAAAFFGMSLLWP